MPQIERVDIIDELRRMAAEARRYTLVISAYEADLLLMAVREIERLRAKADSTGDH